MCRLDGIQRGVSVASLLIAILLLLAVPMSGNAQQQGWYWSIKPPSGGGPVAAIGPYTDQTIKGVSYSGLAMCRDMLGSAQNAHPWACHITGPNPPANCKPLPQLGYGYPLGYVGTPDLVSSDCYQAPIAGGLAPGWYFPFFKADGSVEVKKCSDLKIAIAAHKLNPKNKIGHYANAKCPGAPCITSNVSTACN